MNVYKTDKELVLSDLEKGDLFEKNHNPCTIYMVAINSGFQPTGLKREDAILVVDLENSFVRFMSPEEKVTLLEQTEGLGVKVKP